MATKRKKVTDLSDKSLTSINLPKEMVDSTTIILDDNQVSNFQALHNVLSLEKLSVARNNLVQIDQITHLSNLRVLDLKENNIISAEGLSNLTHLEWLCLSRNKITDIRSLSKNTSLHHLDLSNNGITEIKDISSLIHLKTLLLEGNKLSSLKEVPNFLPPSLMTMTMAENELVDLTEIQLFANLPFLEELSLFGNPFAVDESGKYLFSKVPSVKLDASSVTQADRHSANVFEAEGHLKMLQPGQHNKLARHLLEASPSYSPKFSQRRKSVQNKGSRYSTGVNSSLLESESVHLPLIYDSPPKSKPSSMTETRPSTAPHLSDFESSSWQTLMSNDPYLTYSANFNDKVFHPLPSKHSPEHSIDVEKSTCAKDSKMTVNGGDAKEETSPGTPTSRKYRAKVFIQEVVDGSSSGSHSDAEAVVQHVKKESEVTDFQEGVLSKTPEDGVHQGSIDASVALTADEAARLLYLAAAMIQACIRGYLQRKKYRRFLKIHKAVVKIQAVWRGYYARKYNVKMIHLRNQLEIKKLHTKVFNLEGHIRRAEREKKKDNAIICDALRICMQEMNMQRQKIDEMEKARRAEEMIKNELHGICVGLQNEICHLRSAMERRGQLHLETLHESMHRGAETKNQKALEKDGLADGSKRMSNVGAVSNAGKGEAEVKSLLNDQNGKIISIEETKGVPALTQRKELSSYVQSESVPRKELTNSVHDQIENVNLVSDKLKEMGNGQTSDETFNSSKKSDALLYSDHNLLTEKKQDEIMLAISTKNGSESPPENRFGSIDPDSVQTDVAVSVDSNYDDDYYSEPDEGATAGRRDARLNETFDLSEGTDLSSNMPETNHEESCVSKTVNKEDRESDNGDTVFLSESPDVIIRDQNNLTEKDKMKDLTGWSKDDGDGKVVGTGNLKDTNSFDCVERSGGSVTVEVRSMERGIGLMQNVKQANKSIEREHTALNMSANKNSSIESEVIASLATNKNSIKEQDKVVEDVNESRAASSGASRDVEESAGSDNLGVNIGPSSLNSRKQETSCGRRRTLFPNVFSSDKDAKASQRVMNRSVDSSRLFSPLVTLEPLGMPEVSKENAFSKPSLFSSALLWSDRKFEAQTKTETGHKHERTLFGEKGIKGVYKEVVEYHGPLLDETSTSSKCREEGVVSGDKTENNKHSEKEEPNKENGRTETIQRVGEQFSKDFSESKTSETSSNEIQSDTTTSASVTVTRPTDANESELALNDTVVAVEESFLRRTRTSTPVKRVTAVIDRQVEPGTSGEALVDRKESVSLDIVPDCLQTMPKLVPLTTGRNKSPGMPYFEDQSFDAGEDSFTE
eukprot:gene17691-9348_t